MPQRKVIVYLAVECHGEVAPFVRHRLNAAGYVENGQADVSQQYLADPENAIAIRTAMTDPCHHAPQ
jgi:hypothetical protein